MASCSLGAEPTESLALFDFLETLDELRDLLLIDLAFGRDLDDDLAGRDDEDD